MRSYKRGFYQKKRGANDVVKGQEHALSAGMLPSDFKHHLLPLILVMIFIYFLLSKLKRIKNLIVKF